MSYDKAQLPREDIGRNVLVSEMSVPEARAEKVQQMIIEAATSIGLITEIQGKRYVQLVRSSRGENDAQPEDGASLEQEPLVHEPAGELGVTRVPEPSPNSDVRARRVFVTHGENREFLEPIKKLLGFGELEAIVSVEKPTVSQPVPDKVLNDMRGCGAAIIHVDAEKTLVDTDAEEHTIVNANVLIEIGAAMALYGRRFILLVREGVDLPSNLQGLFEVRYAGEALTGDATIRLMEAINALKQHSLPE